MPHLIADFNLIVTEGDAGWMGERERRDTGKGGGGGWVGKLKAKKFLWKMHHLFKRKS